MWVVFSSVTNQILDLLSFYVGKWLKISYLYSIHFSFVGVAQNISHTNKRKPKTNVQANNFFSPPCLFRGTGKKLRCLASAFKMPTQGIAMYLANSHGSPLWAKLKLAHYVPWGFLFSFFLFKYLQNSPTASSSTWHSQWHNLLYNDWCAYTEKETWCISNLSNINRC